MKRKHFNSSGGFSLPEVMVAIGLMSIAVTGYVLASSKQEKDFTTLQKKQKTESLRQYIRAFMNCERTMDPLQAGCSSNDLIDLKQNDGSNLISVDGTTVSGVKLRSRCDGGNITVEYEATEPRTGWVDLFRGIPLRCPSTVPPPPGGPAVSCLSVNYYNEKKDGSFTACKPSKDKMGYSCYMPVDIYEQGRRDTNNSFVSGAFRTKTSGTTPTFRVSYEVKEWKTGNTQNFGPTDVPTAPHFEGTTAGVSTYFLPYETFVVANNFPADEANFTLQPLDAGGVPTGPPCQYRLSVHSPIVLDFRKQQTGFPKTVSLSLSAVQFDLDFDGIKERTGWVEPDMGFLTLDLNGNGVVDDGLELFGNGTRDGHYFRNGYELLATYDKNQDGVISKEDAIFSQLKVWRDYNLDGVSEPNELFSLERQEVTALSVREVETNESVRGLPVRNRIKFESKYWGPRQCAQKGCRTYDIFFATAIHVADALSKVSR